MSIKGIDVSVHQGKIDWQMVKEAGTQFAMIRAGYGKNADQKDKYFDANVQGAQAAGLHVGAYHYSYALSVADAKAEAATFLKWIAPYKLDYPVAFDIEDKSQQGLGKQTLTAICKAFCDAAEAAGYYVCIYANPAWLKTYLDAPALAQYDLWLAHWTDNPTKAYSYGMWQYTSDGNVAGINGRVDLNLAYKDYPAIIRANGLNGFGKGTSKPAPAPVPAPEKKPALALEVGKSKVRVRQGAKTYDGDTLAAHVYNTVYDVLEIRGDRVVIGLGKTVTAAVKLVDLTLSDGSKPVQSKPQSKPTAIKKGDLVIVNGIGAASSLGTGAKTANYKNKKMRVVGVADGAKYPYACSIIQNATGLNQTTGWFPASAVKKS